MREYIILPEAAGRPLLDYLATMGCTLTAPCGGNGKCGKCRVLVREGIFLSREVPGTPLLPDEEGTILACRALCPPEGGRIAIREETGGGLTAFTRASAPTEKGTDESAKSTSHDSHSEGKGCPLPEEQTPEKRTGAQAHRLGMALDVGTTTLAAALCDLATGQVLATASCLNPQKPFGADVINRIAASEKGHLQMMQRLLLDSVRELLKELLSSAGIRSEGEGGEVEGNFEKLRPGKSELAGASLEKPVLEEPVCGEAALEESARGKSVCGKRAHKELALEKDGTDLPSKKPLLALLTVAGNPTMLHLFCGISPAGMGQYPFTPAFLEEKVLSGKDLSLSAEQVVVLPSASAFLGSDVLGGAAVCGLCDSAEPVLLMDIGTNGELLLYTGRRRGGRFLGASAAAGPALEGAGISCGMGGVRGAVSSLEKGEEGRFAFRTVEDAPPVGICGSGLIDLTALLLDSGVLEDTGYLPEGDYTLRGIHKKQGKGGHAQSGFAQGNLAMNDLAMNDLAVSDLTQSGFALEEETPVRLTAEDVRELQLAKSALRAGAEVLLTEAGLTAEELAAVYLAGGLGYYLKPQSAARIGLLPEAVLPMVKAVGNTALSAAISALTFPAFRQELARLAAECETVELNQRPAFSEAFMEYMLFSEE